MWDASSHKAIIFPNLMIRLSDLPLLVFLETHTCISRAFFGNNSRKNNLTLIGSSCQVCSCITYFFSTDALKKKKSTKFVRRLSSTELHPIFCSNAFYATVLLNTDNKLAAQLFILLFFFFLSSSLLMFNLYL